MGWALYGASGYTGELIAEEAVRRGERPLLLGRDGTKLEPLARRLSLDWKAVGLGDPAALREAVRGQRAVLHAAGPFRVTSAPMVQACLDAGAHYLDITGELEVISAVFRRDEEAKRAGVALVPGVGFDVVPTDCLAVWLARQVERPTELFIAIAVVGQASGGTLRSGLGILGAGGWARRDGALVPWPVGKGARPVRFSRREAWAVPVPLGDLETAFHSTGIPHITTAFAMSAGLARTLKATTAVTPLAMRALSVVLGSGPLKRRIDARLSARGGPDAALRARGATSVYVQVKSADRTVEGWLETPDGYALTAPAAVASVQHLLQGKAAGALSPAMAFGPDFVLELEGVRRMSELGA